MLWIGRSRTWFVGHDFVTSGWEKKKVWDEDPQQTEIINNRQWSDGATLQGRTYSRQCQGQFDLFR
jgi:hypothetical protein